MTDSSLLERTLAANLAWNRARIKFLAVFLIVLTQTRSVNLVRIAAVFGGCAAPASSYKRIQRFLRGFDLPLIELAHLLIRLMKLTPPFVVVIDRTEWKFGSTWHNILTLSLAGEDVAVPILWRFLKRWWLFRRCRAGSDFGRFSRDVCRFRHQICVRLSGEFASIKWLEFLTREKIAYRLRIKANHALDGQARQTDKSAEIIAAGTNWGSGDLSAVAKVVGRYRVCVTGRKRADGELLILISNEPSPEMIEEYRRRRQIETLFGCLKSRGFDLEETHLRESARLEKLLGLLALAICWSWLAGEKLCQRKPITVKKHGRGAKSVFRLGLDYLEQVFRSGSPFTKTQARTEFILILSCT